MKLDIVPWRSLKVRVTLLTLAIFLLGIGIFAGYVTFALRADMQRVLEEQQFSTVAFIATDINDHVTDYLGALEAEAARVNPDLMRNAADLQEFLRNCPQLVRVFDAGITIYGLEGSARAGLPLKTVQADRKGTDMDSLRAVLAGGKSQVGRPIKDPLSQFAVITMTVPIRDAKGQVIGAMAGLFNLGRPNFLDKVSKHRYGKTGSYFLVAPKWRLIITGSDPSSNMGALPAPGAIPWVDRSVGGYEGSAVYMASNGTQVLSSVKAIAAANWYLVARVPTAEVFAPIRALQERRLLAAAFMSLLVMLLTWWMLRHQLAPVTQTVAALAQWDPAKPLMPTLPAAGSDEIGTLIGGFDRLLTTLAHREEELRRAQKDLEGERGRYFDLYDLAPVGYLTVDAKGLILQANLACCAMLGLPHSRLIQMALYRLVYKEDRPLYYHYARDLLASRLVQECELRLMLGDGTPFWAHLISEVEKDSPDAPVFRVVISDINARKKTELALHETHVELEKLVNYSKLYQNERLVALGVMAGGIAHELRNPLSVCFSAAQFLRDQPGDLAEQQQCTQKIIEGIEKSSAIIDNLLRFARPPLDDEMKPTNLVSVLHEAVMSVTAQARLQRIRLLEDYQESNVPILGNAILLQQVLMNLFLNACQAMPAGGEIRTAVRQSASEAVLWVRDTGEGIASENVSRLFDPVFTTRPEGQGNGLGLPICRLIVQRHGGSIRVESVIGEGSTFTIRLPLLPLNEHSV